MVAVAVGRAGEREAEAGETLLDGVDHCVDVGAAPGLAHRIDIDRVFRPILAEPGHAPVGIGLVPEGDVAVGDVLCVGHVGLLRKPVWQLQTSPMMAIADAGAITSRVRGNRLFRAAAVPAGRDASGCARPPPAYGPARWRGRSRRAPLRPGRAGQAALP